MDSYKVYQVITNRPPVLCDTRIVNIVEHFLARSRIKALCWELRNPADLKVIFDSVRRMSYADRALGLHMRTVHELF